MEYWGEEPPKDEEPRGVKHWWYTRTYPEKEDIILGVIMMTLWIGYGLYFLCG